MATVQKRIPESRAVARVREAMSYGKSPVQIARELGWDAETNPDEYSPEWVHSVVVDFLNSFDAYSVEQQLKIAINDLQSLSAEARDNYRMGGDPRHAQQAVNALTAVSDKLQATLDRVDNELFRLDQEQVGVLVDLVNRVTFATMERMYDRHPELLASKDEFEAVVIAELEAARPDREV